MAVSEDLTGRKFGRLTVLGYHSKDTKWRKYWNCRCDCGVTLAARGNNLKCGNSASCGCLQREYASHLAESRLLKHGHALADNRSRTWVTWACMKARCQNPKQTAYKDYGGRGIRVCQRWQSFENFLLDMGQKPSRNHTLERKDNNGNYEPGNCVWATQKQQCRNKRNNRILAFYGRRATMAEWAEITGLPYDVIEHRLNRGRWPVERALTAPLRLWASKTGTCRSLGD